MAIKAMIIRILLQFRHDKRTLALMLMAPILVLTLLYFVFEGTENIGRVAIVSAPERYVEALADYNINVTYKDEYTAGLALENGKIDAYIKFINDKLYVWIDGSDSQQSQMVLSALEMARNNQNISRPDLRTEITYVYGYDDISTFDNIVTILTGFMIFFFVFLIAGISFLQERTTGTLEKLLSTPIKRWEIVVGYVCGFGVVTVLQSLLICTYVIYVLNAMMVGSVFLVLIVAFCTAIMALTLGILLSTAANNEFQMIQFIPLVVIPQVFFTGLFQLSPIWANVGKIMPLYYAAHALKSVMIKGKGIEAIYPDILLMLSLAGIFMMANTLLLKKYRRI